VTKIYKNINPGNPGLINYLKESTYESHTEDYIGVTFFNF